MKKIAFIILIAFTTVITSLFGITTCYAEIADSGDCGSNSTWNFDESGTLTISGTGSMDDYEAYNDMPWYPHINNIKKVVIEDGITKIGSMAFYNCDNLSEVSIPSSVETISQEAFSYCMTLKTVTIPYGVRTLGGFSGSGLEEIQISNSVAEIDYQAFADCASLNIVILPDSITQISGQAFGGCKNLKKIDIPDSVKDIACDTFLGCSSLEEVNLPDGLETINDQAFGECSSLKNITIPDSVNYIAGNTFFNCYNLETFEIPSKVTRIGDNTFMYCRNLRSINIPESVTSVGSRAFEGCDSLIEVHYAGTPQQWQAISVSDYNDKFLNAAIYFKENSQTIYCIDRDIKLNDVIGNLPFANYLNYVESTKYDPKLSYLLAGLSRTAYSKDDMTKTLDSLGFSSNFFDSYGDDDGLAGYSIAKKTLDDGNVIVLITIRGSMNIPNWIGNLSAVNTEVVKGYHAGFNLSKENVYKNLKTFLGGIPKTNVKYVITGHSLGGATGNLLAVELQKEGVPKKNVINYNFACPDVARDSDWNPGGIYDNIFNIANAKDPVGVLPGVILNLGNVVFPWGKYGKSYYYSMDWSNPDDLFLDLSFTIHDCVNELNYLAQEKDVSEFKSWIEVQGARVAAAPSTIIHCFFCPVDVRVYDQSGSIIASVIDGKANYYDSRFGEVMIFVDGDKKYISLPVGKKYDIRMTGTDKGEMTYKVVNVHLDTGEIQSEKTYESIILEPNKEMISESEGTQAVTSTKVYVIDDNKNKLAEIQEDGTETVVALEDANENSSQNNTDNKAPDAGGAGNVDTATGSVGGNESPSDTGNIKKEIDVSKGTTHSVTGSRYKILTKSTVALTRAKNTKSVKVPNTVKIGGKTFKVTQINAKAFTGKKIRTVTIGKKVKAIKKNAFKGSKATKIILKTKLLKKANVKGSLKGSKIKTIQVKIGKKSVNKTYVKKYKKIFTKANVGKKVTVK